MSNIVKIENWSLAIENNEPRVRDLDLAERLGYAQPRDIRKLVKTYQKSGDLSQDDVRAVVARTRVGIAERNVTEFWLSEAAALFIVTKSETKNAIALTKEMIRVFMLVRRGMIETQPSPELGELKSMVIELRSELSRQALEGGMIGESGARIVSERILELSQWQYMRSSAPSIKSAQTRIRQKLCRDVDWGGSGREWKLLPSNRFGEVLAVLKSMRNDLLAEAKLRSKAAPPNVVQLHLPGLKKAQ